MRRLLVVGLVTLLASVPAVGQQGAPDHRDVPRKLFDTGVFDLRSHDGQGAFVDAVVAALHGRDKRWGHLKKSGGQTQVHGHAEDAALYLVLDAAGEVVPGFSVAVDFVGGAGGPNPQPGWIVDAPRYNKSDWLDPFEHATTPKPCPVCPPAVTIPPYAGDAVFDAVGAALFADYAAAGQAPNIGMGRWFGRTIYDWIAGNTRTLQASIEKHRREWREILGLPQ